MPGGVDGSEPRAHGGTVAAAFEVVEPLHALALHRLPAVEPSPTLLAGQTLRHHGPDRFGDLEEFALLVAREQAVAVVHDPHHRVDPDQVPKGEGGGLGARHGLAGDGVHLLHREPHLHHPPVGRGPGVSADAVGYEIGGVLGVDDTFAEAPGEVARHPGKEVRIGVGAADHLHQAHVARRVEKVGDQEAPPHPLGERLGKFVHREAAGVGGEDRALLEIGDYLLREEPLLYLQVLQNNLYHPVALFQPHAVVVEVAGLDGLGKGSGVEGRRLHLRQPLDRLGGYPAAERGGGRRFARRHVQKEYLHPRVGQMRGYGGSHHPCPKHCHLVYLHHRTLPVRHGLNAAPLRNTSALSRPCISPRPRDA